MKNREKINSMTDKELSKQLCFLVETIALKADEDYACKLCPVEKMCKKGANGFQKYLAMETKQA